MKSDQEIKDAISGLQLEDRQCPATAHKVRNGVCLDVGHAIRGTWISALWWVLDLGKAPWKK